MELPILSKEERIEYRDENGRILNDEEVKALEGKVSFKTRYETRTRIVDADGNEINEEVVGVRMEDDAGVAPPHPDVEGINPETKDQGEADASEAPPTAEVAADEVKEQSVDGKKEEKNARPASDAQSATQESEL